MQVIFYCVICPMAVVYCLIVVVDTFITMRKRPPAHRSRCAVSLADTLEVRR